MTRTLKRAALLPLVVAFVVCLRLVEWRRAVKS
jgi:hypothetical protein